MTLSSSDAQPPRKLPHRPTMVSPTHSISSITKLSTSPLPPQYPPTRAALAHEADPLVHEHALDFATNSWDLATGGLKTLTAKRELPHRPGRRSVGTRAEPLTTSRSYMVLLVVVACLALMLLSGAVVLFVMLQL